MSDEHLQAELQEALGAEFTFSRELPRGGMSRVFVATENALRRVVVVKVLKPELAATISAERFKREIGIAARLQHPHIVPLLSSGVAGGHLYYTMPLVNGETLRQKMDRERPMSIDSVCSILVEVAGALAYAHDEGVVHRDIKPENVMFFHGQAVVLDFGIGKALLSASSAETELLRITQVGMSLGTPTYIAPEQAASDPALDHRADLYALGVVAYEMITGHPPFASRQLQAVIEAHALKMPEPVASGRPDVPPGVAAIVMKCLAKKASERPKNGHEIVAALRFESQRGTPAPGSIMAVLTKAPRWLPWAIAGVSTVAAITLAILVLTLAVRFLK